MWSPQVPPTPSPITGLSVQPDEVLYFYDGPTIFTATLGLSKVLFHKFDETDEHDFFVVSQTDRESIDALREGRLSVRGALDGDDYWILQTANNLRVVNTWNVSEFDFPTRLLPERRVGLVHKMNPVPDTLEQANSFFSVKFRGPALSRQSISFRRLKALIGEVYDVANDYLLPAISQANKYSVADFDVAPLKFASLLISLRRPVILEDAIKRRKLNVAPTDGLLGQMQAQRDQLMDGMSEVVEEAQRRDLSAAFTGDHLTWIAALNTLTPSRGNDVDSVEVATSDSTTSRLIVIDTRTADRIKAAHSEASNSRVRLSGKVVEINASASTFVFRANNIRQTTCVLDPDVFDRAISTRDLTVGAIVSVMGGFERRARRDLLHATQIEFP